MVDYSLCYIIPGSSGLVLVAVCFNLSRGGVPGGVRDGELASGSGLLCNGGMQPKQILLGHGPKFTPPHVSHGGVGGGDHGDEPLLVRRGCWDSGVSKSAAGGKYGSKDIAQSSVTESPHSHSHSPHP